MDFGKKLSVKEKEKDKTDKISDLENLHSKYIVYDEKKLSHQQEIYALLSNNQDSTKINQTNQLKVIVLIEEKSPISLLNHKIKEELQKKDQYTNLLGFKVTNLHKISEKGKTMLPIEGIIKETFKESGEIIYFEVESNEYWITCIYKLQCLKKIEMLQIEYKINAFMPFESFKVFLLKSGIDFFKEKLQLINDVKKSGLIFLIKNVYFMLNSSKDQLNYDNCLKDKSIIGSLFGFEGKIICFISFDIFEHLIFQAIQHEHVHNTKDQLRWTEFSEMKFEEVFTNKMFIHERKAIKSISRLLIKKEQNIIKEMNSDNEYYFYQPEPFNSSSASLHSSYANSDITKDQTVFILPSKNKVKGGNYSNNSYTKTQEIQNTSQSLIEDTLVDIELNMYKKNNVVNKKKNKKNFKTFSETPLLPQGENNETLFRTKSKDYESIQKLLLEQPNGKQSKNFLLNMRKRSLNVSLANEFFPLFEYKTLKDLVTTTYYKINFVKREIIPMKMPESREFPLVTCETIGNRVENESEGKPVVKINNAKILIFVIMTFAFYIGSVICIYYDYF